MIATIVEVRAKRVLHRMVPKGEFCACEGKNWWGVKIIPKQTNETNPTLLNLHNLTVTDRDREGISQLTDNYLHLQACSDPYLSVEVCRLGGRGELSLN